MSHARMSQLCEHAMILAVICSPLKHWPHSVLSSSSHLHQLLLSSYISHRKDESKRKLALRQGDSKKTVENCANSICISRQFEYAGDSSQMRRRPTEHVAEHCQLQSATKSQVGRLHMRTRLKKIKRKQTLQRLLDFDWLLTSYDYLILTFHWLSINPFLAC